MKNIDARSMLIREFFDRDMSQLQKHYPSIVEINTSKKTFFTVKVIIAPICFG